MRTLFTSILISLERCKKWIFTIFIIYWITCLTGIILVHNENSFSLSYRDRIVGNALKNDRASIHFHSGNRFRAALIDCKGNLYSSFIQSFLGLSVVLPYFTVSYQGWIGGIVSVNNKHKSRLKTIRSALYYFIVLTLQYIPYSLVIGSGLKLGIETYRQNKKNNLLNFKVNRTGAKDVLNMYLIAIPLFFIASCFEFLSNWNV